MRASAGQQSTLLSESGSGSWAGPAQGISPWVNSTSTLASHWNDTKYSLPCEALTETCGSGCWAQRGCAWPGIVLSASRVALSFPGTLGVQSTSLWAWVTPGGLSPGPPCKSWSSRMALSDLVPAPQNPVRPKLGPWQPLKP